jgi:hypothetical protein
LWLISDPKTEKYPKEKNISESARDHPKGNLRIENVQIIEYQRCFNKWQKGRSHNVQSRGDYVQD